MDCLQHGSRLPKKSLGTMKKRYLGNENYRGLYWRDPTVNSCPKEKPPGSPRTFSTVLYPRTSSLRAKQDRPCPFPFSIPPLSLLCSNRYRLRQRGSYAYFTYLTRKGTNLVSFPGLWQLTSRHNQKERSEALVTGERFQTKATLSSFLL